jgi:hypothetical protein
MKKIAIYHYQPIEKYPPVLNLIHQLEMESVDLKIEVYTTFINDEVRNSLKNVKLISVGRKLQNPLLQKLNYLSFNILSILHSLRFRPDKILYYETISCLPSYFYKRLFKKAEIFVHFHEYMSPQEYEKGMWMVKMLHRIEKINLPKVNWLSHTNVDRLSLFLQDVNQADQLRPVVKIVPNFPPKSWKDSFLLNKYQGNVVQIIYVGFSLEKATSYLEEFSLWISRHKNVVLDLYLHQSNRYVEGVQKKYPHQINIKPSVSYRKLPTILKDYDVGVILYKPHILNFKFNAPNKLFEYYACGLDVWYPEDVIGCNQYQTKGTFPKILPLKFNQLKQYKITELISRNHFRFEHKEYFAENEYDKLIQKLKT